MDKKTTYILLTGAGFSMNLGGWSTKLLQDNIYNQISTTASRELTKLFFEDGKNYEDIYTKTQMSDNDNNKKILSKAIKKSYEQQNNEIIELLKKHKANIHSSYSEIRKKISGLVKKFDIIFTLNQDILLESLCSKYLYVVGVPENQINRYDNINNATTSPIIIDTNQEISKEKTCIDKRIPYIKLHGSSDWISSDKTLAPLIIGKDKLNTIRTMPFFSSILDYFNNRVQQPNTKLMIIGYSGNDDVHINPIINKCQHVHVINPKHEDIKKIMIEQQNNIKALNGIEVLNTETSYNQLIETFF